jgi:hypothetical protein
MKTSMVREMLRRFIQWLKNLLQRLFGKASALTNEDTVPKQPAPPLTDTDLEFLFTELLEGVHQARGRDWVQKWLSNVEHRISPERWLEWLQRFGERLLALKTPNNELASRLVALGELEIGAIGQLAYNIGMELLTRHQSEPIWEYEGPDILVEDIPPETDDISHESSPEGEYETVTLDELLIMLQQDENLRQQIIQQLDIETDDPQVIVAALMKQLQVNEASPLPEN